MPPLIDRAWAFRLARDILFLGFLLNVGVCVFSALVLEREYPHTTFLFRPVDQFQDFYAVLRSTEALDPYHIRPVTEVPGRTGVEVSNYFPLTHILLYPFTWMGKEWALALYLGISLLGFSYGYAQICRAIGLRRKAQWVGAWFVFIPFNYAILMTMDRGNLELWVFLTIAFGIYCFSKQRERTGAVILGLAAAIKAFPLLFLFPLFVQKKYGLVLLSVATFLIACLASALFFEGDLASNYGQFETAMTTFGGFLLAGVNGITHSLSLFSFFYTSVLLWTQNFQPEPLLEQWRGIYSIAAGALLLALLLVIWLKQMEDWKKWALLCFGLMILPFPSYDYKLLYALIPLTFLIVGDFSREKVKKYIWLLCLLITPKVFVLFSDVRVSVLINPLLILLLVGLILTEKPSLVAFVDQVRIKGKDASERRGNRVKDM